MGYGLHFRNEYLNHKQQQTRSQSILFFIFFKLFLKTILNLNLQYKFQIKKNLSG